MWLLVGALLAAAQLAAAPVTRAETASELLPQAETAPKREELAAWGRALASPEPEARRAAFERLSSLSEDALPAIEARLVQLAKEGFDREAALNAMTTFRRVQGVTAPDGDVDLSAGVLPVLEQSREAALAAELIALLRSLEALQSHQAGELIVGRLFALDAKLFRYEAARTLERLSVLLLPALIRHQSHPKPWVRTFCRESLEATGLASPGRAVQQDDVALLSAVLDAYGDTLTFEAMPVVSSYLTDDRFEVRSAARRAIQRFGRNAIWQLRERYLNATGKEAESTWSHQRILHELYKLHDAPKQQAFQAALAQATLALARGETEAAARALDVAVEAAPHSEDVQKAAPLYRQLGERALERGAQPEALRFFRRALRLHPEALDADSLRARIAYLEGALRLSQAVVDMTNFRRASELDADFGPAREALDELTGERSAREARERRLLGFVAAFLLACGGLLALRRTRDEGTTSADVDHPAANDPDNPPASHSADASPST